MVIHSFRYITLVVVFFFTFAPVLNIEINVTHLLARLIDFSKLYVYFFFFFAFIRRIIAFDWLDFYRGFPKDHFSYVYDFINCIFFNVRCCDFFLSVCREGDEDSRRLLRWVNVFSFYGRTNPDQFKYCLWIGSPIIYKKIFFDIHLFYPLLHHVTAWLLLAVDLAPAKISKTKWKPNWINRTIPWTEMTENEKRKREWEKTTQKKKTKWENNVTYVPVKMNTFTGSWQYGYHCFHTHWNHIN